LQVDKMIYLGLALYQNDGAMVRVKRVPFYIIPSLENKVIIGLKTLVGPLFDFFLNHLVYAQRLQAGIANNIAVLAEATEPSEADMQTDLIREPWTQEYELCPEELSTPDCLAISEDVLHYMEVSVEAARREYLDMLVSHINAEMIAAEPRILDLMRFKLAVEAWNGLKIDPIELTLKEGAPDKLYARARPIRAELYKAAQKEHGRLCDYFFTDSDAPFASPLVIVPKPQEPYIRFCGDYRKINEFINRTY